MKENFLRSTILMFMYILFYDLVYAILNPRSLYYFFGINYENVQRFFFYYFACFYYQIRISIHFFLYAFVEYWNCNWRGKQYRIKLYTFQWVSTRNELAKMTGLNLPHYIIFSPPSHFVPDAEQKTIKFNYILIK